jgi:microcystin-dependent protein
MPTQLQLRRGTTSQNNSFTGAAGELSVDTDLDQIRVHDGSAAGGFRALVERGATGNIGALGNTAPAASTVSFGTPANAAIRVSSTGIANVVIGDATVTSGFNLDVRGTANTGAFTGTSITDTAGGGLTPPGAIIPYGGATAPTGYLLCDDSAVSRTTYATLFAILSTTFGTGDGSTTFNVPDLRDRLPLGKGTNNSTLGGETTGASASAVVATAAATQSVTSTTGTFATSAKDSSTATAVTGVTTSSHTHNVTIPCQVTNYIIKT